MNSQLRTCHILSRPLSQATAAMAFIKSERELGHQVHVICPTNPGVPHQDAFHGASITNLPIAAITSFSAGRVLQYARMIAHALEGQRFDAIIVESFRGCGLLPWLAHRSSSRWILHIRNSNLNKSGWQAAFADKLTALETRAYDATVVCDEAVGRNMLGHWPFFVLPNGADLGRFSAGDREGIRRQLGIRTSDRVIIYIGTLAAQRRPQRMLESFELVAAQQPDVKLLIVGDGNQRPALQTWAKEHCMEDRIIFTGRVLHEVIQDYLAAADIGFAYYPGLPNFDANIPLKTVELLAAGLPTVATATHGNRAYITHEVNGLLAEDDPAAMAAATLRLCRESELYTRLRNNARPSAMAYDWNTLFRERLLPLYRIHTDSQTAQSRPVS